MEGDSMASKNSQKRPKTEEEMETTQLLIWGVPVWLKSRFKSVCAQRGTNMKAEILRMIKDYIRYGKAKG